MHIVPWGMEVYQPTISNCCLQSQQNWISTNLESFQCFSGYEMDSSGNENLRVILRFRTVISFGHLEWYIAVLGQSPISLLEKRVPANQCNFSQAVVFDCRWCAEDGTLEECNSSLLPFHVEIQWLRAGRDIWDRVSIILAASCTPEHWSQPWARHNLCHSCREWHIQWAFLTLVMGGLLLIISQFKDRNGIKLGDWICSAMPTAAENYPYS